MEVNGNLPTLNPRKGDKDKDEFYSDIDLLGRVGKAEVLLGIDTLSSNKKRDFKIKAYRLEGKNSRDQRERTKFL